MKIKNQDFSSILNKLEIFIIKSSQILSTTRIEVKVEKEVNSNSGVFTNLSKNFFFPPKLVKLLLFASLDNLGIVVKNNQNNEYLFDHIEVSFD